MIWFSFPVIILWANDQAALIAQKATQLLFGLQTSDTLPQVNAKGFSTGTRMQLEKYLWHRCGTLAAAASPLCLKTNAQKIAILTHFQKIRFHSNITPSL